MSMNKSEVRYIKEAYYNVFLINKSDKVCNNVLITLQTRTMIRCSHLSRYEIFYWEQLELQIFSLEICFIVLGGS